MCLPYVRILHKMSVPERALRRNRPSFLWKPSNETQTFLKMSFSQLLGHGFPVPPLESIAKWCFKIFEKSWNHQICIDFHWFHWFLLIFIAFGGVPSLNILFTFAHGYRGAGAPEVLRRETAEEELRLRRNQPSIKAPSAPKYRYCQADWFPQLFQKSKFFEGPGNEALIPLVLVIFGTGVAD